MNLANLVRATWNESAGRVCGLRLDKVCRALRPATWTLLVGLASWLGGAGLADDTPPTTPPATETPAPTPAPKFPKLEEMETPPAEHFLQGDVNSARDWIVLKSGSVISALPLTPRPNSLSIRQRQIDEHQAARKNLTGEKLEAWQNEMKRLRYFDISIPELEPEPEYKIAVDQIDRIIHHEDQWLLRVDQLIRDRNIDGSLELLGRLEQTRPDWPGIAKRVDDLIFADAEVRLRAGHREEALMLIEEVSRRQPDYPNLAALAGACVDQQIAAAVAAGDFRQARVFMTRLNQIAPGAPVFQKYTAELGQRAQELVAQARAASAAGELARATTLVEQAVRVWPEASGVASAYKSIAERYQRVRVGVTRLPEVPTAYPFDTPAEERERQLTQIPLFEVASFAGGAARYRTRFLDEWMPSDLGRRMRFSLRQTRQPWEMQPTLLGWPITDQLLARLDPANPRFDERLAGYVDALIVESPFEFTIAFRRVPPRIEALLNEPIVSAPVPPRSAASSSDSAAEGAAALGVAAQPAGGFALAEAASDRRVYQRVLPEPERQRQFHVAEIVEQLYRDPEAAAVALQQGDIDVLPNPPAWIARRFQADDAQKSAYFIQQLAVPETHVVQFHPDRPVLRSRELRRALIYASDRQGILDDVLLRKPHGKQGRVVAGPFPGNSRANAAGVTPRPFDPYAGLALALAAKNSLTASKVIAGDFPTLRMLAPPDPVIREAAERLVTGWSRIGIPAELVPDDDLTAYAEGRWDLLYRRVQLTEPVVQLWPFLTLQSTARIDDLATFPDWLKQEIISVDRSPDFIRAEDRVKTLYRHLTNEAALIPLWEVDQYTIYRKNLRGFPSLPVHCYDDVDAWVREGTFEIPAR